MFQKSAKVNLVPERMLKFEEIYWEIFEMYGDFWHELRGVWGGRMIPGYGTYCFYLLVWHFWDFGVVEIGESGHI